MNSLLVPLRIDHQDRIDNLEIFLKFYAIHDFEIIIYEDGIKPTQKIKDLCKKYSNVKYYFYENKFLFQKGLLYNLAAKRSNGEYLIAIDVDVIINEKFIFKSISLLNDMKDPTIILPYNGISLYTTSLLKSYFMKDLNYNTLTKYLPSKIIMHYYDRYLKVANLSSPGGCVIFKRDDYFEGGGFNPHFRGWGYEDDEVLYRYSKFNYKIGRIKDTEAILWHMNHDGTIRDDNPHINENRSILVNIKDMSNKQLKQYIKGWL